MKNKELEKKLFEILEDECGLFIDKKGKWRGSGEGMNWDFELIKNKLLKLYDTQK